MLSKNEIKYIQSLGLKKNRDALGQFVAEGPKIVEELIAAFPKQVTAVYGLESWIDHLPAAGFEKRSISEMELEKISQLQTPNTCLAVLQKFEAEEPDDYRIAVFLDGIQDPGNLGTIIRTADWFGVEAVVCGAGCADLYNPKVVQATMASIGRVPVYYDYGDTWLQKQAGPKWAATVQGEEHIAGPAERGTVLLIGNESKGLSAACLALATHQVTIGRRGKAESLNAAVATGILLSKMV